MNIFVCIKQVPDTETKIKLAGDQKSVDFSGAKWVLNPYDEYAVEEAVKTRDANPGSKLTAISLGPAARVTEALRTTLAMGADEAIVVDTPQELDSFSVAKALAVAIERAGQPDLIFTGRLAIDDNQASVGPMLATLMNLPHVSGVVKLSFNGNTLTAEREVGGGSVEVFEATIPCLLTCTKGLNVPRYASIPAIMKAKKKTISQVPYGELALGEQSRARNTDFELPAEKSQVKMLTGEAQAQIQELVRLLKEEAKVL